jgi:hypothetical protein
VIKFNISANLLRHSFWAKFFLKANFKALKRPNKLLFRYHIREIDSLPDKFVIKGGNKHIRKRLFSNLVNSKNKIHFAKKNQIKFIIS